MDLNLHPAKLAGTVNIPASKSLLHRAMICAALAPGVSTIENVYFSEDIYATIACLTKLGAQFSIDGSTVTVTGIQNHPNKVTLDCGESGSTIRFLIPIAAAMNIRATFTGRGRLITRPLDLYQHALGNHGAFFRYHGFLPCSIAGQLRGGEYSIAGNVSSQFVTGLLLALPLLSEDSTLHVLPPFESQSYVKITCSVLRAFGIQIDVSDDGLTYRIPGGQQYRPCTYTAESDCSQAAFFLTANALGQSITLRTFSEQSVQGDFAIFSIANETGLVPQFTNGAVTTTKTGRRPLNLDASDIPDLVPALAVLASGLDGTSIIRRVARLALKESDRIATTIDLLEHLGGLARYDHTADLLEIAGNRTLHGGVVDSHNDHRIAMAAAMAAASASGDVLLKDAGAVKKSYPTFWEDYQALGGRFDVINLE